MIKKMNQIMLVLVLIMSTFTMSQTVQAANEEAFIVNGTTTFAISGHNKLRTADTLIVYDTSFGASTKNNEWGYEIVVDQGIVTKIFSQGKRESTTYLGSSIPVDGFVISAHGTKITNELKAIKVGDSVELKSTEITYDKAFRVNGGKQIEINKVNSGRSADTLVLYSYVFGQKTGTNPWGYEVIVDRDNIVTALRTKGTGNDSGSEIPPYGYVLSAHGKREADLAQIKVGDTISLVGLAIIELDKTVQFSYVAINPNKDNNLGGIDANGNPYNGFRGANQLVVYDVHYPQPSTLTNDYGYEVIVKGDLQNGVISHVGGNNSSIEEGTFVLSGHGDAASFLINNAQIGASVKVDTTTKQVTIQITPQSLVDNASNQLNAAVTRLEQAIQALYRIDNEAASIAKQNGETALSEAKALMSQMTDTDSSIKYRFLDALEVVKQSSLAIEYASASPRAIEGRAVWHRPKEQNIEAIQNTLQQLKDSGFNVLYLETFFNGHVIFPTDSAITSQNPLFVGKTYGEHGSDILRAFVEEAKKYDIEVHSWVHDFYVGYQGYGSVILDAKPEWELLNYQGNRETTKEGGIYYFMDPSNPEVRQFLLDMYLHIVSDYDVAGIQLDYIRYPVGDYKNDWGFNVSSVQRFFEAQGIDTDTDIKVFLDESEANYQLWYAWKQNNITTFVKSVSEMIKGYNPQLILSTAIFANIKEARESKMQDWPLWVESGYLDVTAPMAYYKDTKTVTSSVMKMVEYVNGQTLNYAGIAPSFLAMPSAYNFYQIMAARDGQAQGHSIFASQNVLDKQDVQDVLKASVHREGAIPANRDTKTLMEAQLQFIKKNFESVYLNGHATNEQWTLFESHYNQSMLLDEHAYGYTQKNIDQLELMMNQLSKYGDDQVQKRLLEDLSYLKNILNTRIKKEQSVTTTLSFEQNDFYFQNKEHTLTLNIQTEVNPATYSLSNTKPLLLSYNEIGMVLNIDAMLERNPGLSFNGQVMVVESDTLVLVFETTQLSSSLQLGDQLIQFTSELLDLSEYESMVAQTNQIDITNYRLSTYQSIQTKKDVLNDLINQALQSDGEGLYDIKQSLDEVMVELQTLLDSKIIEKITYSLNPYYYLNKQHTVTIQLTDVPVISTFSSISDGITMTIETQGMNLNKVAMEAVNPGLKFDGDQMLVPGSTLTLVFNLQDSNATLKLNQDVLVFNGIVYDTTKYDSFILKTKQIDESKYDQLILKSIREQVQILEDKVTSSQEISGDALYKEVADMDQMVQSIETLLLNQKTTQDKKVLPETGEVTKNDKVLPETGMAANVSGYAMISIGVLVMSFNKRKRVRKHS